MAKRGTQHIWLRQSGERRLTTGGALFLLASVAVGLAAANTANNLAYMFFAMMVSLMIVSLLFVWQSLNLLSVKRSLPPRMYAGEPFSVSLTLENHKIFSSSYSLRVIDRLKDQRALGACYALRAHPRQSISCTYTTRVNRRGLFKLKQVEVFCTFPFGLYRGARTLPCPGQALVLPQILPFSSWETYSPVQMGDRETTQQGQGTEFHGLRDYRDGDSAALIHWKVSARTNRLVVREFEEEEKQRVTLMLDNGHPTPEDEATRERFEKAIVACASMASAYLARGYELQLITRAGRVPLAVGESHLQRILRSLALLDLIEHTGAPLWVPPPARNEACVVLCYDAAPPRSLPSNVDVLSVLRTPPFDELDMSEKSLVEPLHNNLSLS